MDAMAVREHFVRQLRELYEFAAKPPYRALEGHSEKRLSKTRIGKVLNAQFTEPVDWDFVVAFVDACASYAEAHRVPLDPAFVDRTLWRTRHMVFEELLATLPGDEPAAVDPPFLLEPFPRPQARPPVEAWRDQPSQLLLARHEVVPFTGREDDLARLVRWRDDPGTTSAIGLLHGPGGQGKTRLAAQLAHMSEVNWQVWQAVHTGGATAGAVLPSLGRQALIVVDYAERWPAPDLRMLLRALVARKGQRLRVLLVARNAGTWWTSWRDDLRQWGYVPTTFSLPSLAADDSGARRQAFVAARERFAQELGLADADAIPVPENLAEPAFGLTLTVHMAALVAVDARLRGAECPDDPESLSVYLLDRERAHWAKLHNSLPPEVMAQIVYTATLTRPRDYDTARNAVACAGIDVPASWTVGQILHAHAECYPPVDPARCLEPLYPDRLGEDFLALSTPGHAHHRHLSTPWADEAAARLLGAATSEPAPKSPWNRHALTVLINAAGRWPHLATGQLTRLLTDHPELALQASSAALAALAELPHLDISALHAIEQRFPNAPVPHLDPGIVMVAERVALARLRTSADPVESVRVAGMLVRRRLWAGLHQRALVSARQQVAIAKILAEMGSTTGELLFADALSDLALVLGTVGKPRAALAAVRRARELWQRLAETDAVDESTNADSLAHLGQFLAASGKRQEGLEVLQQAVEIWEQLAKTNPALHEPNHAAAVGNLGAWLDEMGRTTAAVRTQRRALALWQRLAETNPETYDPNVAGSLNNLGNALARLGSLEEAVAKHGAAVTILRRVSSANPAAYEPSLATALNGLGNSLTAVGRHEEALAVTDEAVTIRQRLAATDPAVHQPDFAQSLNNLGVCLAHVDRHQDAVTTTELAVMIRRRLATGDPTVHEAHLAESLISLGTHLRNTHRGEEAIATTREAVRILRRLAETDLLAHGPHLATALANLISFLTDQQRQPEPLAALEEEISVRRHLVEAGLDDQESALADALTKLAIYLSEAGKRTGSASAARKALTHAGEAAAIRRRLAATNALANMPGLALALMCLATIRAQDLDDAPAALLAIEEAVEIYSGLVRGQAAKFGDKLTIALIGHAYVLYKLGRVEEAAAIESRLVPGPLLITGSVALPEADGRR